MKTIEYVIGGDGGAAVCDAVSAEIADFCAGWLKDSREVQRYRLTAEECLLRWLDGAGEGRRLTLTAGRRFLSNPRFVLACDGEACNPLVPADDEIGVYGGSVLSALGLSPTYTYRGGRNVLTFELKAEARKPLTGLLLIVLSSVLVGVLGGLVIPEQVRAFLLDNFINPVYDTFFNILSCIAGPMIFLSVAWGVYGIGDASTLSRIGKKMMLTYVGAVFLSTALSAVFFPVMGLRLSAADMSGSQLSSIIRMVLGIFPSNIIEPFLSGNTLQIILLSFVVGIALVYLGQRTQSVARAIEQINNLVQFLMGFIGRLVPYVVFIVVVSLFWSGTLGVLASSWKLLAIILINFSLIILGYYARSALAARTGLFRLMRKCLPNLLIALSTASSSATFSSSMEISEKELGVSPSVSSFGVPLAMVMHKPSCAVNFLLVSFFFARQYGVETSAAWLATAVISSAVLAIATPPIPGGGAASYTVLFVQLGLPAEALAIALSLDMITDFLMTATDMYCLPVILLNVADKLGLLDRERLARGD